MNENYRKPIASLNKFPQFTTMNVIDGQAGLASYSSLIFYSLTIDNILNIIVLLILAGVSIATLTGENGLITKANKSKESSAHTTVYEAMTLELGSYKIEKESGGYTGTLIDYLKEKEIIDENYIINVKVLNGGENLAYGNGTDGKNDVYKLEEITELGKMASLENVKVATIVHDTGPIDKSYRIVYYGKNSETIELGDLKDTNVPYIENGDPIFDITKDGVLTAKLRDSYYSNSGGYKIIDADGNEIFDLVIPDEVNGIKVKSIGDSAFYFCANLKSITIPDGITSIGDWAFSFCHNLTTINIPNSVSFIGEGAFDVCKKLTSISLPDNITTIEDYTFNNCKSLESINIPNSVTSIEEYAFGFCSNLSSITIPISVTTIEQNAFASCTALKTVNYIGTQEQWNSITINSSGNTYLQNATLVTNYTSE